ncbi:MAG: hypothetical protein EOO05_18895, partial [Chitinophagaceae bacterium]
MKRADHILALTAAVLESMPGALAHIAGSYVVDEIRKPGMVSLGASDGKQEQSFSSWIANLSNEKINSFRFTAYQYNDERLPARIAAGFAGPSDLVLEVTTGVAVRTYILRVFHAPANELTTSQFITLLNSQPDPALVWARATTLILESNGLNQRRVFPGDETPAYLATDEGRAVFAYLAGELVREIQIESTVFDKVFAVKAEDLKEATIYKYNLLRRYLKEFKKQIDVAEVDLMFIEKFGAFLKKKNDGIHG